MSEPASKKPRLIIRKAVIQDIPEISAVVEKTYPEMPPWDLSVIDSQIRHFPEGQFVAIFEHKIVGYCASLRIDEALALKPHTWASITADGTATTHDIHGEYLYGIELCVDPDYRHHHIGQRFYKERKKLCIRLQLKGIIFGGRMQELEKNIKDTKTAESYIKQVRAGKIHDEAMSFQMHSGFEVLGVLEGYLPEDKKSLGHAVHFIWRNPELSFHEQSSKASHNGRAHHHITSDHVRVATVQYEQRKINSFEEFQQHVEYFVKAVAEYHTDFVVFPEFFTMQLLSLNKKSLPPHQAIKELTKYTDVFKEFMSQLALNHNVNIIGGSHPTKVEVGIQNIAYIFLRDGSIHTQAKIHPTPDERHVWGMKGANQLDAIMTDCGPIGVLICYDSEFPELSRHLIDQGIYILFIPFCTDERRGYLRVRYCAHARAVENQCFVVLSGNVGNLPGVRNMNVQYAQSCILTPSDFPFSHDGVAQDTTPNVEGIAVADLNIKALVVSRNAGTVLHLKDRRHDLYSVNWHPKEK